MGTRFPYKILPVQHFSHKKMSYFEINFTYPRFYTFPTFYLFPTFITLPRVPKILLRPLFPTIAFAEFLTFPTCYMVPKYELSFFPKFTTTQIFPSISYTILHI